MSALIISVIARSAATRQSRAARTTLATLDCRAASAARNDGSATFGSVRRVVGITKVIFPSDSDWLAAGTLAREASRAATGGGRRIAAAFDRVELISDALIAALAHRAGLTVITADAAVDLLAPVVPGLQVMLYDRHPMP